MSDGSPELIARAGGAPRAVPRGAARRARSAGRDAARHRGSPAIASAALEPCDATCRSGSSPSRSRSATARSSRRATACSRGAAARPAAARRGVRRDARAARPPAGRVAAHGGALGDHAHLGLGAYAAWNEADAQRFLLAELASRRPLVPPDLLASPDVARGLRDVPRRRARCRPNRSARTSSRWPSGPPTCSPWSCCRRKRARPAPLRVVPLFETMTALDAAGTHRRRPAGDALVPRAVSAAGRK